MADAEKIKGSIAEIAQRRNNVTLQEIEWVVRQLRRYYGNVASRDARHGKLFRVGSQRFMVNAHHPGSKQVKPYSVDDFLEAMTELGWYED